MTRSSFFLLQLYTFFLSCIAYCLSAFHRPVSRTGVLTVQNNLELAAFQHTRKTAFPLFYCQATSLVVPMEADGGISSLFVVVVVIFVLVEGECAVGTRIDAYLQIVPILFGGILYFGTERQDTAGFYIDGQNLFR